MYSPCGILVSVYIDLSSFSPHLLCSLDYCSWCSLSSGAVWKICGFFWLVSLWLLPFLQLAVTKIVTITGCKELKWHWVFENNERCPLSVLLCGPFLFRPTFQPISILPPHSSLFSYALVVLEDCTQTPLHRLYTHNPSLCKAKHLGKLLAYPLNPLTQTHYHEFCIIYASASTLSRAYASGRYHCQHLYLCWRRVFSSSQFEKWRQKM